jgi:hypothetical protein
MAEPCLRVFFCCRCVGACISAHSFNVDLFCRSMSRPNLFTSIVTPCVVLALTIVLRSWLAICAKNTLGCQDEVKLDNRSKFNSW